MLFKLPSTLLALTQLLLLASARGIPKADHEARTPSDLEARGSCPAIWSVVAADLRLTFAGCNQNAKFAIRFAFHDAAGYSSKTTPYEPASGGADGSLLLSDEISRSDNDPMGPYRTLLLAKYYTYTISGVSAADLVQFAGNIAIKQCQNGPTVKTVVGRKDDSNACPDGLLPQAFGAGSDYNTLTQLFQDKGFGATDLAALMGGHTVSRTLSEQANGIPQGGGQDSTPEVWDNTYYQQVHSPPQGVYSFESDINLSNSSTSVGGEMARFAQDGDAWTSAFTDAMYRLSIAGIPEDTVSGFTDCTSLLG